MNDRDPLDSWSRFALGLAVALLCGCFALVLCVLVALGLVR